MRRAGALPPPRRRRHSPRPPPRPRRSGARPRRFAAPLSPPRARTPRAGRAPTDGGRVVRMAIRPAGTVRRSETSRSAYRTCPRVLGIGVAVMRRTWAAPPTVLASSAPRCSTPKRCCSSTTTRPRRAYVTRSEKRAWVPTTTAALPSAIASRAVVAPGPLSEPGEERDGDLKRGEEVADRCCMLPCEEVGRGEEGTLDPRAGRQPPGHRRRRPSCRSRRRPAAGAASDAGLPGRPGLPSSPPPGRRSASRLGRCGRRARSPGRHGSPGRAHPGWPRSSRCHDRPLPPPRDHAHLEGEELVERQPRAGPRRARGSRPGSGPGRSPPRSPRDAPRRAPRAAGTPGRVGSGRGPRAWPP